ncbi:MAG: discoidin domain-containing protein, partial [Clostridia bacterium]|nr:discoidin domain-containing protein [Clostridia bacterium]
TGTSGMYNEWVFGFWTGAMSAAFNNPVYSTDSRYKTGDTAYDNQAELLEGYMENYGFYPEAIYGEGENSQRARNIQYAKERGIKTTYWYHPAVSQSEFATYAPGTSIKPVQDDNGQYVGPDGRKYSDTGYPWIFVTQPLLSKGIFQHLQSSWIDYSNPSARNVFEGEFTIDRNLWEWGVKGAMIDYGENLRFEGTCWNGLSGMEMHNFNSYYYAKHAAEAFQDYHNGDYVLYERSGCAGSQYFVGNFLGDQKSTWNGFADQIYSMISLGASGFNLYGGDFCGLGGKTSNDLMSRWMVLSTFSPWMRQHGGNIHKPWQQGEANKQNFGTWYYFRQNIVPTVMSAAMDGNKNANPVIKGMMVAYPYQLALSRVNNQYLFCDDFLVCHVTAEGQYNLPVHLPNGSTWYHLFTYERFEGNQKLVVEAPTAWSPVFVKAGAVKAIDLPESMILADEMHDEEDMEWEEGETPHDSLLITPPDEARTSTIYIMDGDVEDFRTYESHTEVYTNKPVSDTTFTLTADNMTEGSQRETILALGTTAKSIKVDGEELKRYNYIPDYFNEEYGYHVEAAGLTTIYVEKGWKEITIEKGDAKYESLPLVSADNAVGRLFDDNVQTVLSMPRAIGSTVEFDINTTEPVEVKRMVLKWAVGFLSDYNVEYTADGETWETVTSEYADDASTVVNGGGSIDVVEFKEGTKAVAFRIVSVETGDANIGPTLYEVDVYAPTDYDTMEPDDEMTTYPEDDGEDWDDEEWDDEEDDEETGKTTKRKKKIIRKTFPLWLIILIAGGAVLLATGILLLILLLLKKKKKKAAEAALANAEVPASEESPTDFPNPAE